MVNIVSVALLVLTPIMFLSGAFIAIYSFKQGLRVEIKESNKIENDKVKDIKEENKSNQGVNHINSILDEYLNGPKEGVN